MLHEILPNGKLRLTADEKDRAWLRELMSGGEGNLSDKEARALDGLVGNSDLQWIPEGTTGDLTSAPMLGILDGAVDETALQGLVPHFGLVHVGRWEVGNPPRLLQHYRPVIARWAYMDYQVRSFIDDLIATGESVWEGGQAE